MNHYEAPTEPHIREKESKALARFDPGGADAPDGARAEEDQESDAVELYEPTFETVKAIWRRPWPDDPEADRRAFEEACRVATPATIFAAAQAFVAAMDDLRYLPKLATWLSNLGWLKEPPQKKQKRGMARGRRSHKPDMAKLALQHGGYVENDDGSMVWEGDR